MSADLVGTVDAFLAEAEDLDQIVAGLAGHEWLTPTPAPGWTIAFQVAHLAWTDEVALCALTDQAAFAELVRQASAQPTDFVDRAAADGATASPARVLDRWRRSRAALAGAVVAADPDAMVPWFGPSMALRSLVTARLMETWLHGCDVADSLGVRRVATDRLRDICHLGVRTRDFAYRINRLEPPASEFRIELVGPSGASWTWGPPEAESVVRGSAEEFCLVVGQRRELLDTSLVATGEAAHWLTFAQTYAGPPKSVVRALQPPTQP